MTKKKNHQQDPDDSSDSEAAREVTTAASGCCHIAKGVDLGSVKKKMKSGFSVGCHGCAKKGNSSISDAATNNEDAGVESSISLWLCLKCGHIGCGRSHIGHALEHCNSPHSDVHAVVVDIELWNVWCYKCDQKMSHKATRKLLECVDYIRRHLPSASSEQAVISTPSHGKSALNAPNPPNIVDTGKIEQTKIVVKDFTSKKIKVHPVRGLVNLGNTCFYNSVLQCLSVTPFLATVLQRLTEMGEKFILPGDPKLNDIELPPVEGELGESYNLTKALLNLLTEMRSTSNPADTLRPAQLLKHVQDRYPLFEGHEQHDAHELLRHLLEGVRADDLKRYQQVLLKQNGLSRSSNPDRVDQQMRKKLKLYGLQLQELTLGVEGIFKGQLVSILECQDCHHFSIRFENFLDLSLPVAEDKPLPPVRKKDHQDSSGNDVTSKYQLKKQKKEARRKVQKSRRVGSGNPDQSFTIPEENTNGQDNDASEQSDADVEDNAEQDSVQSVNGKEVEESGYSSEKHHTGDSVETSPSITNEDCEKNQAMSAPAGDDCSWEKYYTPIHASHTDTVPTGAIVEDCTQSQFHTPEHPCINGHCNEKSTTEAAEHNCDTPEDEQLSITIPDGNGELVMQMSKIESSPTDRPVSRCDFSPNQLKQIPVMGTTPNDGKSLHNLEVQLSTLRVVGEDCFHKEGVSTNQANGTLSDQNSVQVVSQIDHKDIINWCKTMSSKQQTEDGECSVISCLNQFTSLELMTGNNKVGCDSCTQRLNKGKEGKTVYTNSTKQLLISSPPAVLILHLKRFMMENFRFRKLQRYVSFPLELDLGPFCTNKCKDLPSISNDQIGVHYSLFGVVEHTGSLNTGHYVAYIKIRTALGEADPRWSFLPQTRDFVYSKCENQKESQRLDEKWYSISDSRVVETAESKVLKTQAYLLFYERVV